MSDAQRVSRLDVRLDRNRPVARTERITESVRLTPVEQARAAINERLSAYRDPYNEDY
jgi:hypothetical protein